MYMCINEHPAWTQEDVRLISDTVIFIHRDLFYVKRKTFLPGKGKITSEIPV